MEHTPIEKWKISFRGLYIDGKHVGAAIDFTPDNQPVGEGEANIAFLDRAVHSHDELVAALKETKQFLHEVHCRWPEDADYGGSVLIDVDNALNNVKGK